MAGAADGDVASHAAGIDARSRDRADEYLVGDVECAGVEREIGGDEDCALVGRCRPDGEAASLDVDGKSGKQQGRSTDAGRAVAALGADVDVGIAAALAGDGERGRRWRRRQEIE